MVFQLVLLAFIISSVSQAAPQFDVAQGNSRIPVDGSAPNTAGFRLLRPGSFAASDELPIVAGEGRSVGDGVILVEDAVIVEAQSVPVSRNPVARINSGRAVFRLPAFVANSKVDQVVVEAGDQQTEDDLVVIVASPFSESDATPFRPSGIPTDASQTGRAGFRLLKFTGSPDEIPVNAGEDRSRVFSRTPVDGSAPHKAGFRLPLPAPGRSFEEVSIVPGESEIEDVQGDGVIFVSP